jgi:hypothetical protein
MWMGWMGIMACERKLRNKVGQKSWIGFDWKGAFQGALYCYLPGYWRVA